MYHEYDTEHLLVSQSRGEDANAGTTCNCAAISAATTQDGAVRTLPIKRSVLRFIHTGGVVDVI